MRLRRTALVLTTLALLATACGGGGDGTGSTEPGSDPLATDAAENLTPANQLVAQVASFDMATGEDQRLLVGLFTGQRQVIGGGEIRVRIGRIPDGEQSADTQVEMSEAVDATFLPVPGKEPEVGDTPAPIEGSGAGVYEAEVDLDQPGTWGVQVEVELDGEPTTATAVFPVAEEHGVPAVGDPAPSVDNPTVDDPDVDPAALDSRAQGGATEVPDPELHDASIAEVLEAGRPMVVVVSTPVYCVSQFCGPITDTIAEMSETYGDRAEFVHLEVWQDFNAKELNPAAEEWIFDPETGGNEPWVFLVGADGLIQQRWDNVLDAEELTAMLEALPAG